MPPGLGHELSLHDEAVIVRVHGALRLDGLDEVVLDLLDLQHLPAGLLQQLAHLIEVGVEGNRVQRPPVVPQLQRAHRDFLDPPLGLAHVDIFAQAERILDQEEEARDHVAHQCLAAEDDGEHDHACARQQGPGIDPHGRERDHHHHDPEGDLSSPLQERQQRAQARMAHATGLAHLEALLAHFLGPAPVLGGDRAVGPDANHLPDPIADKEGHQNLHQRVRRARADTVRGEAPEVDPPGRGQAEERQHHQPEACDPHSRRAGRAVHMGVHPRLAPERRVDRGQHRQQQDGPKRRAEERLAPGQGRADQA